jgi:hypothetical protein
MKAYWVGGIAPLILDLGTRWRRVVRFTRRLLYPQAKSLWYSLDRRLGGLQSRSGRGGEEKNSQLLPGLEPPIIQPVAQRCPLFNNALRYEDIVGVELQLHTFLTSEVDGIRWSVSLSGRFNPG